MWALCCCPVSVYGRLCDVLNCFIHVEVCSSFSFVHVFVYFVWLFSFIFLLRALRSVMSVVLVVVVVMVVLILLVVLVWLLLLGWFAYQMFFIPFLF